MLRMIEDDDVEDDGVQEDDVENDAAEDDVEEEDRSHFVRTCTVKMHLEISEEPPFLRKFTERGLQGPLFGAPAVQFSMHINACHAI